MNETRPIATPDSLAAFVIADALACSDDDMRDSFTAVAELEGDDPTPAAVIDRFIDIELDELFDNDTLLYFDCADDYSFSDSDADRFAALLTTAYTEIYNRLFN